MLKQSLLLWQRKMGLKGFKMITVDKILTKEAIFKDAVSYDGNPCIYFLIKDDTIVYVGQTVDLTRRVNEHKCEGKKDFDSFSSVSVKKRDLDKVESLCILYYRPIYNERVDRDVNIPLSKQHLISLFV